MGSKSIKISFTDDQVEQFDNSGHRLCFAAGVGDNPVYNVIASCHGVYSTVEMSWTDEFEIAASKDSYRNGVKFSISTNPTDIKFQQVYALPRDWTNTTSTADSSLPPASFRFQNDSDSQVSAVVYRVVNGESVPFYFSQFPILSSGSETLTPTTTIVLWMQRDAERATLVSISKDTVSEFDMTTTSSLSLKFDGSEFVQT